jgi:dihydrolipoamide dehydrogenase
VVPHAVFTYPEVAAVGLGESQAVAVHGEDEIIIGYESYANTTKGHAMGIAECFVKLVMQRDRMRILGAHIIGPQASVMIQEIVNLMVAGEGSVAPLVAAMHTHPALSEVVSRAAFNTMPRAQYRRQWAENRL